MSFYCGTMQSTSEYESTFKLILSDHVYHRLRDRWPAIDGGESRLIIQLKSGYRVYANTLQRKQTIQRKRVLKLVQNNANGIYYPVPILRRYAIENTDVRYGLQNPHELQNIIRIVRRHIIYAAGDTRVCLEQHYTDQGLQYQMTGEVEYDETTWLAGSKQAELEDAMFVEVFRLFGVDIPMHTANLFKCITSIQLSDIPSRRWNAFQNDGQNFNQDRFCITYKLDGFRGRIVFNTVDVLYYDDLSNIVKIECSWFHQFPNIVFQVEVMNNVIVLTDIIGGLMDDGGGGGGGDSVCDMGPNNFKTKRDANRLYMPEAYDALQCLFRLRESVINFTCTIKATTMLMETQQPYANIPQIWRTHHKFQYDGYILTTPTEIYKIKVPTIDAYLHKDGYMYVQNLAEPIYRKKYALDLSEHGTTHSSIERDYSTTEKLSIPIDGAANDDGCADSYSNRRHASHHQHNHNNNNDDAGAVAAFFGGGVGGDDNAIPVTTNTTNQTTTTTPEERQVPRSRTRQLQLTPDSIYELCLDFKRTTITSPEYLVLRKRRDRKQPSSEAQYNEFMLNQIYLLRLILYMQQHDGSETTIWFEHLPSKIYMPLFQKHLLRQSQQQQPPPNLPLPPQSKKVGNKKGGAPHKPLTIQTPDIGGTIENSDHLYAMQKEKLYEEIKIKLATNKHTTHDVQRCLYEQYAWSSAFFVNHLAVIKFLDLLQQIDWLPLKLFMATIKVDATRPHLYGTPYIKEVATLKLEHFFSYAKQCQSLTAALNENRLGGVVGATGPLLSSHTRISDGNSGNCPTSSPTTATAASVNNEYEQLIHTSPLFNTAVTVNNKQLFDTQVYNFVDMYDSGASEYLMRTFKSRPIYGVACCRNLNTRPYRDINRLYTIALTKTLTCVQLIQRLVAEPQFVNQIIEQLRQFRAMGTNWFIVQFDVDALAHLDLCADKLMLVHCLVALSCTQNTATVTIRLTHFNQFVSDCLLLMCAAFEKSTIVRSKISVEHHDAHFVGLLKRADTATFVATKMQSLLLNWDDKLLKNRTLFRAEFWLEPNTYQFRNNLQNRRNQLLKLDTEMYQRMLNYNNKSFMFYDSLMLRDYYKKLWHLNDHYTLTATPPPPLSIASTVAAMSVDGVSGGNGGVIDANSMLNQGCGEDPKLFKYFNQNYIFSENRYLSMDFYNKYQDQLQHCYMLELPKDELANLVVIIKSDDVHYSNNVCPKTTADDLRFLKINQHLSNNFAAASAATTATAAVDTAATTSKQHLSKVTKLFYVKNRQYRPAPIEFDSFGENFMVVGLWNERRQQLDVIDAAYVFNCFLEREPLLIRRRFCYCFVKLIRTAKVHVKMVRLTNVDVFLRNRNNDIYLGPHGKIMTSGNIFNMRHGSNLLVFNEQPLKLRNLLTQKHFAEAPARSFAAARPKVDVKRYFWNFINNKCIIMNN